MTLTSPACHQAGKNTNNDIKTHFLRRGAPPPSGQDRAIPACVEKETQVNLLDGRLRLDLRREGMGWKASAWGVGSKEQTEIYVATTHH